MNTTESIIALTDEIEAYTGKIPQSIAHNLFQSLSRCEAFAERRSSQTERNLLIAKINEARDHIKRS